MCVGKGKVGKKAGEKCGKKKKVVDEEDPMDDEKREEVRRDGRGAVERGIRCSMMIYSRIV